MNVKILFTFFISLFLLTGCGGYKTATVIEAETSYLFFNGETKGAEYSLDSTRWYKIENTGENELYPVSPGKQRVMVRKGNEIIVDRIILLSDTMSKEIQVP